MRGGAILFGMTLESKLTMPTIPENTQSWYHGGFGLNIMSDSSDILSYTDLSASFQKIEPNANIAQVHGILCGMLCGADESDHDLWPVIFPHAKKSKKGEGLLKQLYEATYHQLSEFSFEFRILLPEDETDINLRAEALGLWCQGFLLGLEHTQIPLQNHPKEEVKEALDDIIEIAKITFGDIPTNDEDETAYYELVEYVKLSALMIFHELQVSHSEEMDNDDDTMLH